MPTPGQIANRRLLIYLVAAAGIISFLFLSFSRARAPRSTGALAYSKTPIHHVDVQSDTLKGEAIMPKLGNETLKQVAIRTISFEQNGLSKTRWNRMFKHGPG